MPRGTVKWFSEKKGWGFIVDPDVHSDIFVHYSQIQGDGFRTLAEGDEVDYELFSDNKGAKARNVVRVQKSVAAACRPSARTTSVQQPRPEDDRANNLADRGLRRLSAPGCENVALVGFMGSGKSSVGRLVAHTLEGRFVDTDRLVIERAGREITEIFAEHGEAHFRAEESRALKSLLGAVGLVIATGGGIVTVPENLPMLKELGLVVWLTAGEEVIWERVSRNKKRPLLHTENPRETVRTLLERRNPLYEAVADMTVDTSQLTHAEVAERICDRVRADR